MPTKWDVIKALKQSQLPSHARLLLFVLVDEADENTRVVPEKFSPSFDTLITWTGLSKGSVSKFMNQLEAAGWLIRERFPGRPTRYTVAVGTRSAPEPVQHTNPPTRSPHERVPVHHTNPTRSPGEPPNGHPPTGGDLPPGPTKPPKVRRSRAAEPKPETAEQRVNRLARSYYDQNPISTFTAVRGIVKKATTAGLDDATIIAGLQKVIDEKRPLTAGTLHYAIYGRTTNSKTTVYRDDAPGREYGKWTS